jgi:hypothetical protein
MHQRVSRTLPFNLLEVKSVSRNGADKPSGASNRIVTEAALYKKLTGANRVYYSKVFHDLESICPFDCHFHQLQAPFSQAKSFEELARDLR